MPGSGAPRVGFKHEFRPTVTPRDKRQRTFKLSGSTEAQIAQLCHATGSGATAVVEQALAHYYREMFGRSAMRAFATPAATAREDSPEDCPPEE